MSELTQEFFWTPAELIEWIQQVCADLGLWLVIWRVARNADMVDPLSLQPSMFESAHDESVQLFLGKLADGSVPQWRAAGDCRELDFANSYAVQLVPSILVPDGNILLQGRLAIMRAIDYEDKERASKLIDLFRRLRGRLERDSDPGRVVVQSLSSGKVKRWEDMLVGKALLDSTLTLKQFSRGEVEFRVDCA